MSRKSPAPSLMVALALAAVVAIGVFFWRLPVPAVAPVEAPAPIASSRPAPALPKTAPKAPANERVVPATPPATDAAQPPPPAPFALTFKPDELQAVVAEMFEGMLPRLALTPAQKEALRDCSRTGRSRWRPP